MKQMEKLISIRTLGILIPIKKEMQRTTSEIAITVPGRGITGPIRVGKLIEPIKEITNHPDRDRLMAELFKDYK